MGSLWKMMKANAHWIVIICTLLIVLASFGVPFIHQGCGGEDEDDATIETKEVEVQEEAVDVEPPTIVQTVPEAGATDVPTNTPIRATFSEEIDPETLTQDVFIVVSGVSGEVSYADKIATYVPSTELAHYSTYTATIYRRVKDLAGNVVETDTQWTFTTGGASEESSEETAPPSTSITETEPVTESGEAVPPEVVSESPPTVEPVPEPTPELDTIPPTIISTFPADSAVKVPATIKTIQVEFSEEIDPSTIATSTFILRKRSMGVQGDVYYESGGKAYFHPSMNLSLGTTYIATISAGVKDTNGNPMGSSYSWKFTTQK